MIKEFFYYLKLLLRYHLRLSNIYPYWCHKEMGIAAISYEARRFSFNKNKIAKSRIERLIHK